MIGNDTANEHATEKEVIYAIKHLSEADKIKLIRIAKLRIRELKHCNWEDLINTAMLRVITRTRKWPKSVTFLQFITGCIRSIASEIYEKEKERRKACVYSENTFQTEIKSDSEGILDSALDESPDQEAELILKQLINDLISFFENDKEAYTVLILKVQGYPTEEIKKNLGINNLQYATTFKRISRKLLQFRKMEDST